MTPKSDLKRSAPEFQFAYLALLAVISPKVDGSTNPNVTTAAISASSHFNSSVLSNKRPSEITVDPGSSKRPKPPSTDPQTPDQPTVLPNPSYSDDSVLSGASNESTDEELSRRFLESFVDAVLACMEDDFMELRWSKSGPTRLGFG
jgi:hypothetical protein